MATPEYIKFIYSILLEIGKISQPLLTPLIAVIAIYIAYQQYKNNKDRLRLNIFDKRFRVFMGLMKLHVYIIAHTDISDEALDDYKLIFHEGQFLFDSDTAEHLDNVYNQAVKLQAENRLLDAMDIPPDTKIRANTQIHEITKWFLENFKQEKTRFEKYLRFK